MTISFRDSPATGDNIQAVMDLANVVSVGVSDKSDQMTVTTAPENALVLSRTLAWMFQGHSVSWVGK